MAKLKIKLYQEEAQIVIQASVRKKVGGIGKPNFQLVQNDFIPDYTIWLLPEAEMVTEKIRAALTRSKPRDFFDVYFLLRHQLIPINLRPRISILPKLIDEKNVLFNSLSDFLPQSMSPLAKDFKKIFKG